MSESDLNIFCERALERATEAFGGDELVARDWLESPNPALGCSPHELLVDEEGYRQVERVLERIEHGVYE